MAESGPDPTGRRGRVDGADAIVLERGFDADRAAVWSALTEPAGLAPWVGTYSGDPATGSVAFRMTAEGEDAPEEHVAITACEPRRHLAVRLGDDWRLDLVLGSAQGRTHLAFAQLVTDPVGIGDIGPGWEYYLDRLAAVLDGRDATAVRWEDYHPAQSEHYLALFR